MWGFLLEDNSCMENILKKVKIFGNGNNYENIQILFELIYAEYDCLPCDWYEVNFLKYYVNWYKNLLWYTWINLIDMMITKVSKR
jgi:hypothetical protein